MLILAACSTSDPEIEKEGKKSAGQLEFSSASLLRVADNLVKAHDYTSALRIYQDVLEKDPKNITALIGQGDLFMTVGAPEQAAPRFQAVTRLAPADGRGDAGLARALTQMNEAEVAVPHFTSALEKGAASATLYNHYGVALDLLNRHSEAQVEYGRGMDMAEGDLSILNNLGLSLALSEDYAASVRILSDVVSAAPDAAMARQNLAVAYALSGDQETAMRITTVVNNAAVTEAMHHYINSIVALPKELRAKAIFAGLDTVADALPKVAPVVAAKPAAPPEDRKKTAPAMVDITTSPQRAEELPHSGARAAAPTPPAEPTAQAAVVPPAGEPTGYMVQLGAYLSEGYARAGWRKFKKQAPALVTGEPVLSPKDDLIRLGIAAADKDAALSLCIALKEAGLDCMVRHLSPNPNE